MSLWRKKILLVFLLIGASGTVPLAHAGCLTLEEMVARLDGLTPGTPVRFKSIRGTPYDGVVESVATAPDGRRILNLRGADGTVRSLLMEQLAPSTFASHYESLTEGMEVAILSKSQKWYQGKFKAYVPDGKGGGALVLEDANGKLQTLQLDRLQESSVLVKLPQPAIAAVPVAAAPLPKASLANGQVIESAGDASYISFEHTGTSFRASGRINRIWRDPATQALQVEVEEVNLVDGSRKLRQLSHDELQSARVSTTAKLNFEKYKIPGPSKLVGAQPLGPKAGSLSQPLTPMERAQNIRSEFPVGSPSRVSTGDMANQRINPSTGREATFVSILSDRKFAEKAGKIFENVSPAQLPKGKRYTYIITDDGKLTFGMVDNSWEYGVKHFHLANGRPVLAAGELEITAAGKFNFNLESGTFTRKLTEKGLVSVKDLSTKVRKVFDLEVGASNVSEVGRSEILVPYSTTPPTPLEIRAICRNPGLDPTTFASFCL